MSLFVRNTLSFQHEHKHVFLLVSLVSSGGRWLWDGVLYIPYAAAGEISSASSGSRSLEVEPSDEPMRVI